MKRRAACATRRARRGSPNQQPGPAADPCAMLPDGEVWKVPVVGLLLLAPLPLRFDDCPVPIAEDWPVPIVDALPVVPAPPTPAEPEPHGLLLSVPLLLSVLPLLGVPCVLGAVVPPLVDPEDMPPAPPVPPAPPAPPAPPPPPAPCAIAKPTLPARKTV